MLKTLPHYRGKSQCGERLSIVSSEDAEIVIPSFYGVASLSVYRQLIRTGLSPHIPEGFGVFVQGIPGLCHSRGITLVSPFMLTSESYGEIKVVLVNFGATSHVVRPGDRIAEAIIVRLGGKNEENLLQSSVC